MASKGAFHDVQLLSSESSRLRQGFPLKCTLWAAQPWCKHTNQTIQFKSVLDRGHTGSLLSAAALRPLCTPSTQTGVSLTQDELGISQIVIRRQDRLRWPDTYWPANMQLASSIPVCLYFSHVSSSPNHLNPFLPLPWISHNQSCAIPKCTSPASPNMSHTPGQWPQSQRCSSVDSSSWVSPLALGAEGPLGQPRDCLDRVAHPQRSSFIWVSLTCLCVWWSYGLVEMGLVGRWLLAWTWGQLAGQGVVWGPPHRCLPLFLCGWADELFIIWPNKIYLPS